VITASVEETETTAPTRPAYAIYVLILLIAACALSNADRHVFAILLPAIREEFGLSNAVIGLIAGPGFFIPYLLFTLPLARLADRRSRRMVLAGAVAFWSVASAFCGIASNAWQLAIGRIGVGMGEAGGGPPSQSIVATLFSKRRSIAMGALAAGVSLGVMIGMAGGAAIAARWGWRASFLALAAPGLPLALLIWLTGPRRSKPLEGTQGGAGFAVDGGSSLPVYPISGAAVVRHGDLHDLRLRSSDLDALLLHVIARHVDDRGVGSLAGGAIVDALVPRDKRWQLRVPAAGLLLSFPLLAAMFLLPGGAEMRIAGHSVPLIAPISLLSSFLTSLWAGPSYAAVARLVPTAMRAQAIGLLVIVLNATGSLLGPLIAGLVSDILTPRFGTEALRYSLLMMSTLVVVGGLVIWRASHYYRSEILD
jgi:MFS family permease